MGDDDARRRRRDRELGCQGRRDLGGGGRERGHPESLACGGTARAYRDGYADRRGTVVKNQTSSTKAPDGLAVLNDLTHSLTQPGTSPESVLRRLIGRRAWWNACQDAV